MKRAAPVLSLLLLAPWVREFLLGNISARQLPALLILTLLYGCGAVRQRSWWPRHLLALVAAALMTYAWLGFVLTSLVEPGDPIRWAGNIAFAAVALAIVIVARRRIRTAAEKPQIDESFAQL